MTYFVAAYTAVAFGYALGAAMVVRLQGKTVTGGGWALAGEAALWPLQLAALLCGIRP